MTATQVQDLGSIFVDGEAYADPARWHATAERIRRETPILRVEQRGFQPFWAITKHADVLEVERHADVFVNTAVPTIAPGDPAAAGDVPVRTLVQLDGDEHKAHRQIVNDWFKPGNLKRLQGRIDELAAAYVDRMAELGGECDFQNDVALHLPLDVIMSILGLPEQDYPRMLQLTQELFGAEDPDVGRVGEDASVIDVLLDFMSYFSELTKDRRESPTGDLASVIANATIDGAPLEDMQSLGHYLIIATAGHDTTSSAIGGGLLALLEQPDQLQLLRDEPELIDHAADELIRFTSPVKHFARTCTEPFTIRGVTFEPGERLYLSYASANRDEDVFHDPHHLDVRRPNASNHLGFGFGRHFCLGAHLARMEIRAILRELLARVEHIELAGEPAWIRAYFVEGPKRIPVRYRMR